MAASMDSGPTKVLASLILIVGIASLTGCERTDLNGGPAVAALQPGQQPKAELPCENPPSTVDLDVSINEVMLDNVSTLADADGNFGPWIELFNPSSFEFHLGGTLLAYAESLLSPPEDQLIWEFPCDESSILGPGEFLIVFLDGGVSSLDELHASFVPDPTTSSVFFLNDGSDVVTVPPAAVAADTSIGRPADDPGVFVRLESPSPGNANGAAFVPIVTTFVRGDVDSNGIVDASDLSLLTLIVLDPDAWGDCVDRLDVDDDGQVTILDVSFLALQLAMVVPQIPAPFPQPGTDPSDDSLDCSTP